MNQIWLVDKWLNYFINFIKNINKKKKKSLYRFSQI